MTHRLPSSRPACEYDNSQTCVVFGGALAVCEIAGVVFESSSRLAAGCWSRLRLRVAHVLEALARLRDAPGFLLLLLTSLLVVWNSTMPMGTTSPIRMMAMLGQWFYVAVVGMQLSLVLLAAPAATAGAICLTAHAARSRTCL